MPVFPEDPRQAVLLETGSCQDMREAIRALVDPVSGIYSFPKHQFFNGVEKLKSEGHLGGGQTVAIVDTGIDTSHPLLRDTVVESRNFTEEETAGDNHGHGTLVALVIRYMVPQARLINAKVFPRSGSASADTFAQALEWVATKQPAVVNLSAGIPSPDPSNDWPEMVRKYLGSKPRDHWLISRLRNHAPGKVCRVCEAAARLVKANVCVCAAVGNQRGLIMCPGRKPNQGLVLVGTGVMSAVTGPAVAEYSAYWPDLIAPEIPVAEGTSFSAPFVSGLCALMQSAVRAAKIEKMTGTSAFRRADNFFNSGNFQEAANLYRSTLESLPHVADHASGKLPAGACEFCQAVVYTPQMKLGFAELELDHTTEAVACFAKNVVIAPAFADAYMNLGTAQRAARQFTESLGSYEAAIRLAPQRFEAYDGLGETHFASGAAAEALKAFNRSHLLNPNRQFPLLRMADIFAKQGDQTTAGHLRQRATQCPQ